jgi:Family of unknown function (DUF5908)
MALEVNEIGIRMQVRNGEEEDAEEKRSSEREEAGCGCLDRDEIVEECVRRVLQALKEARER